jgi:O-antigen ligase
MQTALNRIEGAFFSPDARISGLMLAALILAGGLIAALLVAVAGPLYAVVALVGAAGAVLVLRDMRWGFVVLLAVVALLPFGVLPVKIVFTPTFLDVALAALYFVWILRIATRRQEGLPGSGMNVLAALFLAMAGFAFFNGLRFGLPTVTTIRNVAELALAIFFFFVVLSWAQDEPDLYFLARAIMVMGAATAAIAVLFYIIPEAWTVRILDALGRFNYPGGAGALRYIEDDPENAMRAIGTMVDPNVLGGFMILIAALSAPQLVSAQPLFRRWLVALFLGLELVALYLTYSRGSLVGLAVAVLVIGVLRYRKLLWLALAAGVLLLLLPPTQAYVTRFMAGIQLQDRATLMRLGEYRDALGLISRYPWFGVGFSGSPDADLYVGVSNLYLLMAEEMGAVGVAIFLLTIGAFFVVLWRGWRCLTRTGRPNPRLEALLLGIGAAVAGAMVGGVFDHYLFNLVYPHMAVLFWLYLAMGVRASQMAQQLTARSAADVIGGRVFEAGELARV